MLRNKIKTGENSPVKKKRGVPHFVPDGARKFLVVAIQRGLPESLARYRSLPQNAAGGLSDCLHSFAKLYWHEPHHEEIDLPGEEIMRERWSAFLQRDPLLHPNLSREEVDFSLGK